MHSAIYYQMVVDRMSEDRAAASTERLSRSMKTGSSWASAALFNQIVRQGIGATFGRANRWFVATKRNRGAQRIIESAATVFVRAYPEWEAECFDKHFLTQRVAPLLQSFVVGEQSYFARVLAEAWTEQFSLGEALREALLVKVTPIAAEFLYILKTEAESVNKSKQQYRYSIGTIQYA